METTKMSGRQMICLLSLELFGVVTLVLPGRLCETLSTDAPVAYVAGFLLTIVYALLLCWFFQRSGQEFKESGKLKKIRFEILRFLFLIQIVLLTVFFLNLTGQMVQQFLMPQMGRFLLLFSFFLTCMLGAGASVLHRARMAEFVSLFLWTPFVIMMLLAVRKIDMNQYHLLFTTRTTSIVHRSYEVFLLLQTLSFGLFASGTLGERKAFGRGLLRSLVIAGGTGFFVLLVLMGVFGADYTGQMQWPAIRVLRDVLTLGGFWRRLDVFMLALWLFSLFFLVSGGLQYARELLGQTLDLKMTQTRSILFELTVFLLAWLFSNAQNSYYIYKNYMFYIGTPLTLVFLVAATVWTGGKRHAK